MKAIRSLTHKSTVQTRIPGSTNNGIPVQRHFPSTQYAVRCQRGITLRSRVAVPLGSDPVSVAPGVSSIASKLPIPLIDMSLPEDEAARELRVACTEFGFFVLTNHGVPQELVDAQFEQSHAFFNLPLEEKMKILSDKKSRGYSPMGEQKLDPGNQVKGDTKESIYIWGEKQCPPAGSPECELPFHGPNQWPEDLPKFKRVMEQYIRTLDDVHQRVNRLLALALHLPADYFEDKFNKALLTLRPIHYSAEASDPANGVFAAGAHTDWAHLTFLVTDGTPGLQIQYKGEWLDVPHLPGTSVCNLGDMTERWTNNQFKSTMHRVVNVARKERYSCAFFTAPNYNCVVECLPTCEEGGIKFEPITCAEYLHGKYAQTHAQFAKLASQAGAH